MLKEPYLVICDGKCDITALDTATFR